MGRDVLAEENYVHALPSAGYTKTRTGYRAPMALDMDAIPGRIAGMLHDVAMRPSIVNASKVFYDHDIRSAVRKHYGDEYRHLLIRISAEWRITRTNRARLSGRLGKLASSSGRM